MRLEFRQRTSDKFWDIRRCKNVLNIQFGRIGTKGQTITKRFSSVNLALKEEKRLIQQKKRKGYVPFGKSKEATAITAIQIGEHVVQPAEHLVEWLHQCLKKGLSPKHFSKLWMQWLDGDETAPDCVGEIENIFEIPDFYRKAVRNRAERFIIVNDNAFVSLVAVRGNPGAYEIEQCMLENVTVTMTSGGPQSKWPAELDCGVPIKSLEFGLEPSCVVLLCDGRQLTITEDYSNDDIIRAKLFIGSKKVREYRYQQTEKNQ